MTLATIFATAVMVFGVCMVVLVWCDRPDILAKLILSSIILGICGAAAAGVLGVL